MVGSTASTSIASCHTGGIMGNQVEGEGGSVLISCTNRGVVMGGVTTGFSYTGGIAGKILYGTSFHLCHNSGTVTAGSGNHGVSTGGLLGYSNSSAGGSATIYDCCTNTGTPTQWIGDNAGYSPVECTEHN